MERVKQEGPNLSRKCIFDFGNRLTLNTFNFSVPAHMLHLEKLVAQYGATPVLDALDDTLCSAPITEQQRMCMLIASKYTAMVHVTSRVEHYSSKLEDLISQDRLTLSLEAFSMEVMSLTYTGRADQAVNTLLQSFEWLSRHDAQDTGALNNAAAYVCKQFGHFELALHFSYLGYAAAITTEDEFAISWARYYLLNLNRLVYGGINLKPLFDQELCKLKSGELDLGLHANFLLPVYAASHELRTPAPDLARAEQLLDFAAECGTGVDHNLWASWSASRGYLDLRLGRLQKARSMLQQAEQSQDRVDATVDSMKHVLRRGLKMQSAATKLHWTPATARAWAQLQSCADRQQT